jgi:hypothetical protein
MVAVLVCTLVATCGGLTEKEKRALKAAQYPIGRTEAQLIADVGEATLVRPVDSVGAGEVCKGDAKWAIEYHFPADGIVAAVNRALRLGPNMMIVVCLDDSRSVTGTHEIDF